MRSPDDAGKEVRRILHKTRSITIENFNEQFKGIFGGHAQAPTRGRVATRRFALGAIRSTNSRSSSATRGVRTCESASKPSSKPPDDLRPGLG